MKSLLIIALTTSLYLALVHASPPSFCPFSNVESNCTKTEKYRRLDGSCNNLENTMLGKSVTPYKRLLPPFYEDDNFNQATRKTSRVDGQPLPNPRKVSLLVHSALKPEISATKISHLGVMFGQFVNHDLGLASSTALNGTTPLKCTCQMNDNQDCLNVDTPSNDTVFADQSCMSLTRSGAAIDKFDCTLNAREQTNLVTHWLDLSQLYGNDLTTANGLRSLTNGLLRTSVISSISSKMEQLPKATAGGCVDETSDELCFQGGDSRTAQNLLLSTFHMVFTREHNKVARKLQKLNPTWTDENLFHEARRINIATYQHIGAYFCYF